MTRLPELGKPLTRADIEALAYDRVLRVRGSNDVPGFDLCVKAEINNIRDAIPKATP